MFENLAVLFHLRGATRKSGVVEKDTYAPSTREYYFSYGK
ncbi:hypothetical protein WP2S18C03_35010 [Aeromonas veronii]|nr:hypothetical protein WP2S18C03_35010 [Aeromonas veronii]